jgi:pyruvate dehydrogenase E1 component beta subunit
MAQIQFSSAINQALHEAMALDPSVICYGLGVTDPKAVFGTTSKLEHRFGAERVFDMPTSENAMTGVAIGAALNGIKSVMTHQRTDFFLLAMDQLVNGAAKWHYMFGGQCAVPITIRLIIGRGWGQGPTHSQNLQAWFAHIPGLRVVMPTTPSDAKGLLLASIFDPNPVVFLEHRWLHNTFGEVPEGDYRVPLNKAKIAKVGADITIVAMSYMTVEALHAANYLETKGISCEVIDLRTIKPLDWQTVMDSVVKTGRLLALDSGFTTGSVAGEIVARVTMEQFNKLKVAPGRLAMPDVPEPTSPALTKGFYIRATDIVEKVLRMLDRDSSQARLDLPEPTPHDVPGEWFKGPF